MSDMLFSYSLFDPVVLIVVAIAWRFIHGNKGNWVLAALLAISAAILAVAVGKDGIHILTVMTVLFIIVALACYALRLLLVRLVPSSLVPTFRSAPLTTMFGFVVVGACLVMVVFAPLIAPFSESEVVSTAYAPASATYPLGTDQLGRDMLSRVVFGGQHSITLALSATFVAFSLGVFTGLFAAVRGGIIDQLFGRLADILMSVPALILALLLLSILGTNLVVLVGVVATIYVPRIFRLTRSVASGVAVSDFVEASRVRGEGDWYLIRREILPNIAAPLIAEFGLEFCYVFLLIAGLSFLGLGIQPPLADWGSMVRESAVLISFGEVTPLIPAMAIALLTVSVNFIVDWMLQLTAGLREQF